MAASLNDIRYLAEKIYSDIWLDWYSPFKKPEKATLQVINGDSSSGYSHKRNLIVLFLPDGNLFDADILDVQEWPIWKRELVHEMLHEYQNKVIKKASNIGSVLKSRSCFLGPGHDDKFYSAVAEKAKYFNFTPEDFFKML